MKTFVLTENSSSLVIQTCSQSQWGWPPSCDGRLPTMNCTPFQVCDGKTAKAQNASSSTTNIDWLFFCAGNILLTKIGWPAFPPSQYWCPVSVQHKKITWIDIIREWGETNCVDRKIFFTCSTDMFSKSVGTLLGLYQFIPKTSWPKTRFSKQFDRNHLARTTLWQKYMLTENQLIDYLLKERLNSRKTSWQNAS